MATLLARRVALAPAVRTRRCRLVTRAQSSAAAAATAAKWAEAAAAPHNFARNAKEGVAVTSAVDSGNIEVTDISSLANMRLRLHADPYCEEDEAAHAMWFHYRVTGARGKALTMRIENAGEGSYPEAWPGYAACASYDLVDWFRLPTSYDGGVLTITATPACDAMQVAFFAPYTLDRHQNLVARMQAKPGVRLHMLGESLDGHDLDLLQFGELTPDKRKVWVIARQHPGETQAEWFAEGLMERLTDPADPVSRYLLRDAVLFVMPNVCPDGTFRGHLRTNAAGINLNRAWDNPCEESAPEVYHLLRKMDDIGVDLFIDVHGDEELPHNFVAGAEGIPRWSDRMATLQDAFCASFRRASPDFQTKFGYEVDAPNGANMKVAGNQVPQRFDCLGLTLEMPFKDTADFPDEVQGWSPERAKRFGASMLTAVWEVLPLLRD